MENETRDPVQILAELSKNPEILKSMMGALTANESISSGAENVQSTPQIDSAQMPDLSAMLSDPQTLAKISSVMSALKGSGASPQAISAHIPSNSPDKSAALLLALKPYLSADRQAAIENLIKFSKFGEILKNM